jgi:flagellar basal body-associated protein FliL
MNKKLVNNILLFVFLSCSHQNIVNGGEYIAEPRSTADRLNELLSTSENKLPKSNPYSVSFGAIVTKLGDSNYMRTNFAIQSSSNNIEQIIMENKTSLTEAAIEILSVQTVDALNSANGRELVCMNLINRFNRILGDKIVDQISFTEMMIQ